MSVSGGVWLETRPRWCVSTTKKGHAPIGAVGLRCTSVLYDPGHTGFCMFGFSKSSKSWCIDDMRHGFVCATGYTSWLRFGEDLQEFRWWKMEIECVAHIDVMSRVRDCERQLCVICLEPTILHSLDKIISTFFIGR